jgi:hypothetical protein
MKQTRLDIRYGSAEETSFSYGQELKENNFGK